jgi:F0F1-type ATP synthase assembly protein I
MTEQPKKLTDRSYYIFAMKIVGDFTGTIAVPAVLFALLGTYLDEKYNRSPLFLLVGLALAFGTSMLSIYKKTKKYSQEYQEIVKTDSTQK